MIRLSVFVITLNEERNIERCLGSVKWADEIVVVDSFSSDRTQPLAKQYTDRVFSREFKDYADQKNYALSLTGGEWVLSLDADEEVPEALREEILSVIARPDACDAYRIRRESFIFGRKFRYSGTQSDRPIRLWRKGRAKYRNPIHEVVDVRGRIGVLSPRLLHYPYHSVSEYWERLNRYTTLEARFLKQKKRRLSGIDFVLRPGALWLKQFILQQGFRDGWQGFCFCFFSAAYSVIKYAKYEELLQEKEGSSHGMA